MSTVNYQIQMHHIFSTVNVLDKLGEEQIDAFKEIMGQTPDEFRNSWGNRAGAFAEAPLAEAIAQLNKSNPAVFAEVPLLGSFHNGSHNNYDKAVFDVLEKIWKWRC